MEGVEGEDLFSILLKQTKNKEETREDAGGDHKRLGRHNEVEAKERGQRSACPSACPKALVAEFALGSGSCFCAPGEYCRAISTTPEYFRPVKNVLTERWADAGATRDGTSFQGAGSLVLFVW